MRCATGRSSSARAVAAVVGTITVLINQLAVVLSGTVTLLVVLKTASSYLIPFLASTHSAVEINRMHQPALAPGNAPPATPGAAA